MRPLFSPCTALHVFLARGHFEHRSWVCFCPVYELSLALLPLHVAVAPYCELTLLLACLPACLPACPPACLQAAEAQETLEEESMQRVEAEVKAELQEAHPDWTEEEVSVGVSSRRSLTEEVGWNDESNPLCSTFSACGCPSFCW